MNARIFGRPTLGPISLQIATGGQHDVALSKERSVTPVGHAEIQPTGQLQVSAGRVGST